MLRGRDQTATDLINLPFTLASAGLTHDGTRNFIVEVISTAPRPEILVNIGEYGGSRLLFNSVPVRFRRRSRRQLDD